MILVNRYESDLLQDGFCIVPVVGIGDDNQFFIHHAVIQDIGTIADQRSRTGPLFTTFYVGFLHRVEGKVSRQITEPRQRFVQLDA